MTTRGLAVRRYAVKCFMRSNEAIRPVRTTRSGGGGGVPTGDKELDELARRLYDRLRSRLRQELLVDRERSGLLSDLT